MTTGTEVPAPAGEGEQVLLGTVTAAGDHLPRAELFRHQPRRGLRPARFTFSATGENVVTISVVNNQFVPKNPPPVAVGTKVRWVWATPSGLHTVTPDVTEPPRSGDPVPNPFTYEHTFNTPGTFAYYCEVHGGPGGVGMAGTIMVQ